MVHDGPHRARPTEGDNGCGDATLAEPTYERAVELKGVDQRKHVVGQEVEGDGAAAMHGLTGTSGIGSDHVEVLRQGRHVRGVGDRDTCPDRVGRDHASVEEHQRLPIAGLDVVDVDAVGVDRAAFGLSEVFLDCHCAPPRTSGCL